MPMKRRCRNRHLSPGRQWSLSQRPPRASQGSCSKADIDDIISAFFDDMYQKKIELQIHLKNAQKKDQSVFQNI
jgi:hypothetical protein